MIYVTITITLRFTGLEVAAPAIDAEDPTKAYVYFRAMVRPDSVV